MTASTGKRSFRACLRCRHRKTKCDLDGSSGRKEPPCRSCHLSGNDCVLVQSRRGQRRNKATRTARDDATDISEALVHENESTATSSGPSPTLLDTDQSTMCARSLPEPFESSKEIEVELRNPSDALEILARSDERLLLASTPTLADDATSAAPSMQATKNGSITLDEFELLTTGILQMGVILELLQKSVTLESLLSGRSPAPLRHATKKVRMISELLIMVQDSIYRQPGLTPIPLF